MCPFNFCYSWYLWTDCTAGCRLGQRRRSRRPPSVVSSKLSWSWRANRVRTAAKLVSCRRSSSRRSRRRRKRKTRWRIINRWRLPLSTINNKRSSRLDAIWVVGDLLERSGWLPKKRRGGKYDAKEIRWQRLDAASEEWIIPMPYLR